jgi:hypothetical protein
MGRGRSNRTTGRSKRKRSIRHNSKYKRVDGHNRLLTLFKSILGWYKMSLTRKERK